MLETLAEAFKEAFNEESRVAWNKLIDAIAKYMLKGIAKAKEQASTADKTAGGVFIDVADNMINSELNGTEEID